MAVDANQIVVGANGVVSVAPKGTALPTNLGALNAAFKDLGYVHEDGGKFSDSRTIEKIGAWQAFGPVRRVVTEKDTTFACTLLQFNPETVKLAFGGGAVTEPDPVTDPGIFRYDPPAAEDLDERAMVVEWEDDYKYRLVIEEGLVTEGVETPLTKAGAASLPITFGANHTSGSAPWYLITNDPAFDPTP